MILCQSISIFVCMQVYTQNFRNYEINWLQNIKSLYTWLPNSYYNAKTLKKSTLQSCFSDSLWMHFALLNVFLCLSKKKKKKVPFLKDLKFLSYWLCLPAGGMHLSEYAFLSVALNCMPSSLFEMKIITIIVSNNNNPIIPDSGRTEGRQVMIYWVCISARTRNRSK